MNTMKTHDLRDFMQQITEQMAAEYARIQKRAVEDPGTAGDQGEENWAQLLREWLPSHYHVVTKGRLINERGETSPQVDVLVLKSSYPPKLHNNKHYLAAGVAAAFECKTTLKAQHVREAIETCAKVKSLFQPRVGSPFKELHAPIIYGLLAHSHSWKGPQSTPLDNIEGTLFDTNERCVDHPRLELDLLCVADFQSWSRICTTYFGPHYRPWDEALPIAKKLGPNGAASSGYIARARSQVILDNQEIQEYLQERQGRAYSAVGEFIKDLCYKIAWEDPTLRELAIYFANVLGHTGVGSMRTWPASIYSDKIRDNVVRGIGVVGGERWNEWSMAFD
ncbi:MAG: hypothetical protein HYU77_15970 [Betaproteobacteria bacterium]|nr:hypothetical protein [Betaproteobacteria bacterium]